MGQPIPPGDNVPLYDGLDASWNEFVNLIPEEKRSDFAGRVQGIHKEYEPLKQWEDLSKSGITPDHVSTALDVFSAIENKPKQVYEAIGQHLGITPQQAKEVVEEIQESDSTDPQFEALKRQVDTIAQVMLAQRNQTVQEQQEAEANAALEKELNSLKKKYGEVDEEEVLMRMMHHNMTAEQAYQAYTSKFSEIRKTRPAPMVLSGGGNVPRPSLDVKTLDSKGTKNLVAEMLAHANEERRRS